ncbi:MAG TPA: PfkB family carbohydrate kinase [Pyrinomonadaceae bacterium]|nr:PfkB family carbohydrate kinase [Pyrinomonadaceae bacterium]
MTSELRQREAQLRSCRRVIGVGGIGSGLCFELEDNHDLGRNESRGARLSDARDYCKLHIVMHYLSSLLNSYSRDPTVHFVPLGKVGNDAVGKRMLVEMEAHALDVAHVQTVAGAPTLLSVCFQYPDKSGGNITASNSAASKLTIDDVEHSRRLFAESKVQTVALAVPEVPLVVRQHLLRVATEYGAFRVGSFTASEVEFLKDSNWSNLLDLVALNEEEASKLVGHEFSPSAPDSFLDSCSAALAGSNKQIWIVITAGRHGAFGYDGAEWIPTPAVPTNVVNTAGAGDALLAGTLAALMMGCPFTNKRTSTEITSALDFGVLFASYSATSQHTIHPLARLDDVRAFAQASGHGYRLPDRNAAMS